MSPSPMNSGVLALFLSIVACSLAMDVSIREPTADEIQRGFEVLPLKSWGHQARKQNSMRILAIGGSNTAYSPYTATLLNGIKRGDIKKNEYFQNNSYVLNYGISGCGPSTFIGKKYEFEQYNASNWPNIAFIDASVNTLMQDPIVTMTDLERLVHSLAWKYHLKKLPSPDIFFYNMIHFDDLYVKNVTTTRAEREAIAATYPSKPKFWETDDAIRQFAQHYNFPVLSIENATVGYALRQYVELGTLIKWRFASDPRHISYNGADFGVEHLLRPFLRAAMTPRESAADDILVDYSVQYPRLFPPQNVTAETVSYFVGKIHTMNELDEIIVKQSQWTKRDLSHFPYCYGATDANAKGEVRFRVPSSTDNRASRVQVTFIHSWNSTRIGNASCTLHYHPHQNNTNVHLSTILIDGQSDSNRATVPIKSEFGVDVVEGLHSVKCVNLVQDRLSCMLGVHINTLVLA